MMYFDDKAKRIDSPMCKLIMYLNKYEPEALDDKGFLILFQNLETNFKKLFYTIAHITKIQLDIDFIEKYDKNSIVSISSIEYCYYKISTIFDIAYQIAEKLIFPRKTKGNRYEYLEKKFEVYANDLTALRLSWYKKINKIRNKIVHGGIKLNSFYVNDKNVKNRICFQVYDFDLCDLIEVHGMYSNKYNNNINFADNYFVFHTHLLYSYLTDFFEFVLMELGKNKSHDIGSLRVEGLYYDFFEKHQKTWLLSEVDVFFEITKKMIALNLSGGNINHINKVGLEDINRFFDLFPFTMMNKINQGDWDIVENES